MPERVFIHPSEIILINQNVELKSFDDLLNRINERQHYFLHTLEMLMAHSDLEHPAGWEKIIVLADGSHRKFRDSRRKNDNLFTGKMLCTLASVAMADGIYSLVNKYQLPVSVQVGLTHGYYNGEDWKTSRPLGGSPHNVVRLIDHLKDRCIYFDSTYSQINHRFSGRIVQIPESDYEVFYHCQPSEETFCSAQKEKEYRLSTADFWDNPLYQRLLKVFN